VLKGTVLSTSS